MENPVIKPNIPYKGHIPGGLVPGRMCRIQGVSHPDADRFNINFQTGPRPMDDTALHISVRHKQGYIARNSYINEEWGEEMGEGDLPIGNAESWEIIILVDQQDYKIAVNGQHFTEFPHRVPISKVTDLLIDGEVSITLISWEGIMAVGGGENSKKVSHNNQEGTQWAPQGGYGAPQSGYGAPQGGYGAPQGGYGPPQGGYGPPQGYGGYGPTPGYGGPQGYGPPPPPGAEPENSFDNFLDGAQSMLAGAIKSGAATSLIGKLLGSGDSNHQDNQRGYAHHNAKYGIYPDLPQDMDLNLDKGHQQPKGPVESLLSGLLYGGNQQSSTAPGNQPRAAAGGQGTQQSGPDIVSLLSGLLSSNNQQSGTPGGQLPSGGQIPPGSQPQGGDNLSTFLSGLLTGHNQQSGAPGSQVPPGGQVPPSSQPQGGDNLSTFLTGLLTGHNNQPAAPGSQVPHGGQIPPGGQVPPSTQPQSGDNLTTFLTGLLTGPNQQPGSQNQEGSHGHGGDLLGLMSGLLSGTATRPIQETHPSGNHPTSPPPNTGGTQSQTDFGSILTQLLSGGSQQPGTTGYQGPGNVGPQGPGHQGPGTTGYQSSGTQQSQGIDLGSLLIGLLAPSDNNPQSGGVYPPYGGKTPYSGPPGGPYSGPTGGSQPHTGPYSGPTGGSQPHTGPIGGFQPYSGPTGGPQPPIGSSQPHSGQIGGSQPHTGPVQPQGGNTAQSGGGSQGQNTSGGGQRPISASKGAGADFEDVSDQFEREMAQQGHRQYSAKEGEQYGYYPQPPEQHQGPIESLVSGLFGGGGGHQQQQPQHQSHIPQFGGGPSVGGLGSMGGILNFAGNILHPKDDNQRHNY